MKLTKKLAAFGAALLAVCLMFTSCTGQQEDTGVANETDMKIAGVEDLEGKSVAVQLRSEADTIVVDGKLTNYVKRYENMENAARDLVDKKIAAMVVDANYAKKLVADNQSLAIVEGASVGTVEYKFAALKENGGTGIVEKFNQRILELQSDSTNEFNEIIRAELASGEEVAVSTEEGKEFNGTLTFMADPYFKPFIYDQDGTLKGFFATVAEKLAYSCGANLEIKKVEPGTTLQALDGSDNAFAVVSGEVDAEKYAVSSTFYASELVIVVRSDNAN